MSSPLHHPVNCEWGSPSIVRVKALREDSGFSYREIEAITTTQGPFPLTDGNVEFSRCIPKSSAWRHAQGPPRRTQRALDTGRPKALNDDMVQRVYDFLEQGEYEELAYTYESIIRELGLECSVDTLRREIHNLDYFRCKACQKGFIRPSHAKRRVHGAETLLATKGEEPEDWMDVRCSDECHWGWGHEGVGFIFRKRGERYHLRCIQHVEKKPTVEERNAKRKHGWAAVGYYFKSPIIFYDAGNKNGKMSLKTYRDQILEPVVKGWTDDVKLGRCKPFILEEDGDSGHGSYTTNNIVNKWKRENHLNYYFNVAGSPDLAYIENCWQAPKQWIRQYPHFDDDVTTQLILEGWSEEHLPQAWIDKQALSMPQRLWDVIDLNGQMTGW